MFKLTLELRKKMFLLISPKEVGRNSHTHVPTINPKLKCYSKTVNKREMIPTPTNSLLNLPAKAKID